MNNTSLYEYKWKKNVFENKLSITPFYGILNRVNFYVRLDEKMEYSIKKICVKSSLNWFFKLSNQFENFQEFELFAFKFNPKFSKIRILWV